VTAGNFGCAFILSLYLLPDILWKYSTSTVSYKTATYRISMHVLKLSLEQNSKILWYRIV
jgi:hypothetical protein